ncbi:hypothetical protein NJ959_14815 [Symplocastrum sp. BBK-W-15]|uniref:Uncharacterized protein n=1 Tax=Limnofasciculus baicalensis BBK-W-15 TaxID=2699891 RepID=A0AAE3KSQ9_9CYAN|nr:hypothetical protein [Limnofasciculus baicalensis BBK-W-15]
MGFTLYISSISIGSVGLSAIYAATQSGMGESDDFCRWQESKQHYAIAATFLVSL